MEDGTQEPQATLGGEPEPTVPAAAELALYVVQARDHLNGRHWEDVAYVEVPPRTRRKSVLEKALADTPELKPTVDEPREYRVLDAQSFEVIPASMEPPEPADPVLRIG